MNHYTGIFQLFAVVPVWVVALFVLMIGIGVPFVIADRTTGLFFNVSYSGVLGDLCLIIVVLIGTTVIQDGLPFPTWFSSVWPQLVWAGVCLVVGFVLVTADTPWPIATWPDRYHNFVVVPVLLFLLPLLLLAILYNGNATEMAMGGLLIVLWCGLGVYDFETERINQPEYVAKKFGLQFEKGRIVPVRPPEKK